LRAACISVSSIGGVEAILYFRWLEATIQECENCIKIVLVLPEREDSNSADAVGLNGVVEQLAKKRAACQAAPYGIEDLCIVTLELRLG
jgi:hypothetical protein